MTQPTDPERLDPQHLDYSATANELPSAAREDLTPWFGYIGIGIAIVAMLVGFAGMILFVLYFLGG